MVAVTVSPAPRVSPTWNATAVVVSPAPTVYCTVETVTPLMVWPTAPTCCSALSMVLVAVNAEPAAATMPATASAAMNLVDLPMVMPFVSSHGCLMSAVRSGGPPRRVPPRRGRKTCRQGAVLVRTSPGGGRPPGHQFGRGATTLEWSDTNPPNPDNRARDSAIRRPRSSAMSARTAAWTEFATLMVTTGRLRPHPLGG